MAVTFTAVKGAATIEGNKRIRVFDAVFSGNYTTGGEAVTPASVGLKVIERVQAGPAFSTNLVSANPVAFNHATNKLLQYESAATGLALIEKTAAEAYETGSKARVTFIGY